VGQYVTAHDDVIAHVNISSLKVEDGGEYTCTAHNEIAQVSHSSRINVYGVPFVREMPSVHVVAGKQLIVKCPVAGYPIESINWERGKGYNFKFANHIFTLTLIVRWINIAS